MTQIDQNYDVAVIGGGAAGCNASLRLAQLGKKTVLIEREFNHIGGTCINEGCIPMKSWVHSAELYDNARQSKDFGINISNLEFDMKRLLNRTAQNIDQRKQGVNNLLKNFNVDIIYGTARFKDPHNLVIADSTQEREFSLSAQNFIIGTGADEITIPEVKPDGQFIFTASDLFKGKMTSLPKSILIIGGGYIGCEFASFFSRVGVEVTIIELMDTILHHQDNDVISEVSQQFEARGIKILTNHKVENVSIANDQVSVNYTDINNKKSKEATFDRVLVAIGNTAHIEESFIDNAGIELENGSIKVDANLRTNVKHIFAAGDVLSTPKLAYTAFREAKSIADLICENQHPLKLTDNIPRIIFTHPQIASVGITEKEAELQGISYTVQKKPFKANGMAIIMGETNGFVKLLSEKSSGKILGGSIVGPFAVELIHTLVLVMEQGLTRWDAAQMIYGHPTLSELIGDTAG